MLLEQTTNQGFYKPNGGDSITDDRLWKENWDNLDGKLTEVKSELTYISHNVKSFGAKGDGVTNDDVAVQEADSKGGVLLFPPGRYILTSPPDSKSYGVDAVLVVEDGYEMALDSKPMEVNSVWQTYIRLNNTDLGINAGKNLDENNYGNVAVGNNTLKNPPAPNKTIIKNIAIGHNAINGVTDGYQNTVIGTDAGRDSIMLERNTIVGSNAGISMGDSVVTEKSSLFRSDVTTDELDALWAEWRAYAGTVESPTFKAVNRGDAKGNTAIGRNAMGWAITPKYCVGVGYNALEKAVNGLNTIAIGEGALYNGVKTESTVAIGTRANADNADNLGDVSIGHNAMQKVVHSQYNTALGFQALSGLSMTDKTVRISDNVALGRFAMANTQGAVASNVAVGASALRYNQGNFNVALGQQAAQDNESGNYNVAIGYSAARALKTASNATALGYNALNDVVADSFTNITGVGQSSTVTGSDQLQLGNSATTPYAFNGLQIRSDERDKLDIEETQLGLEFINKLRPVQYRQNFRESYIDYDEEGNMIEVENDGSRAGQRKHQGLIAQEVKQVMDEIGVDFAGYQDHTVNGGRDVKSLGYEELIAPLIKSVQELTAKVQKLESQLAEK